MKQIVFSIFLIATSTSLYGGEAVRASREYRELLEQVNQQLSMSSGHFQTLLSVQGAGIGFLSLLLAILAIGVTVLLYRQSADARRTAEIDRRAYFSKFDEALAEQKSLVAAYNERLEKLSQAYETKMQEHIKELEDAKAVSESAQEKKKLQAEISKVQSDVLLMQAQMAAASATASIPYIGAYSTPSSPAYGRGFNYIYGSPEREASNIWGLMARPSDRQCSKCGKHFQVAASTVLTSGPVTCPFCGNSDRPE